LLQQAFYVDKGNSGAYRGLINSLRSGYQAMVLDVQNNLTKHLLKEKERRQTNGKQGNI
jgi:hypothetical protein